MSTYARIKLAIVDDHKLFRKGLISLIEMVFPNFEVLFEADSGIDLQQKISPNNLPDIVLMDVNMPGMNGFAAVQWLRERYPHLSILIVSMLENEATVIQMLKLGVKGYLCKDVEPQELKDAIYAIMNKGFYYTDFITGKLVHSLQVGEENVLQINNREKEFIHFACSDLTYQEIADKMFLSPKTIDGYRNSLFEKFNVKSRVGLVLYAIRNGVVKMESIVPASS